jgi:hypothetical protein
MKKLIALVLALCTIPFISISVAAAEENIVDSINATFEGVSTIQETEWYTLTNAAGDSKGRSYSGLSIKTGNAHSGNNYISLTADKSWHSPSINLHPFFKKAGAGKYVITYYVRSKDIIPTGYQVRALKSDFVTGDEAKFFPSLEDRTSTGDANYFMNHSGTYTDDGEWKLFKSKVIEVSADSLKTDHNWWFCLSSLLNTEYTVDIDDFCIRRATAADEAPAATEKPSTDTKPTSAPTGDPSKDKPIIIEEGSLNCIDKINSDFEDANSLEDTRWYTLTNSFGDSKARSYTGLSIKSGNAHSGKKYLSLTATLSWYSPSINLYPFLAEAGAGEYVLTFYARTNAKKSLSGFMVRGLVTDIPSDDDADYFPGIADRGNSNYYNSYSCTVIPDGDWKYIVSDPFEVTASSLESAHNWWFVTSGVDNGGNEWTVDIDDFALIPASDYVDPNEIPETDITYLSKDVIDSALKVEAPVATLPPIVNANGDPVTNTVAAKTDITLYICLAVAVVAVGAIVPTVIIKLKKKEQ